MEANLANQAIPFPNALDIPAVAKTVTGVTWLFRANIIIQAVVTVSALAWGTIYTMKVRKADPCSNEVFKLRAINDVWFGTRSGIAITLASEWTKTIVIMMLVFFLRQLTPAMIRDFAYRFVKE